MALGDSFNNLTVQNLIDDNEFISALVPKLTTGGIDDNRVYTKTAANTALAGKANVNGDNLTFPAFVTALAAGAGDDGVYTKTAADAALAGKANVNGDNLTFPAFVTALAAGAGDDGVYTKTAADAALADKLNINGDNADEDGVNAMLATLTGNNRVVKIDGTNANGILHNLAVPSADAVANVLRGNPVFINAIKTDANAQDPGFQEAVKNVMSQPHFDIPESDDAALNWTW